MREVQFGLGLVSLGRPWGFHKRPPPGRDEALRFLDVAVRRGVRVFDTAPSYGASEALLGESLRKFASLLPTFTVATKFGEHWNEATGTPFINHSFGALKRSIDRSMENLPKVDLLQLHKATVDTLQSTDVEKAFEYAETCGIHAFGASVSDVEALRIAMDNPRTTVIQMPYNRAFPILEEAFELARVRGKQLYINRPFGMGVLLFDEAGNPYGPQGAMDAYRFVLRHDFRGAVLTGTLSDEHLRADMNAFERA